MFQGLFLALVWASLFPSIEQKNNWLKSKELCEKSSLLEYDVENKMKNVEQNRSKYDSRTKIYKSLSLFFVIIYLKILSNYSTRTRSIFRFKTVIFCYFLLSRYNWD